MKPWLIADSREKDPMPTIKKYVRKIEIRTLETGDYACSEGCCGFERKALDFDNYSRTLMQINELMQAYEHHYMVVNLNDPGVWLEGGHRTLSAVYPIRVGYVASIAVRIGFPLFVWDHLHMLDIMYAVIDKHHDGKVRGTPGEFHSVRRYTHKDDAMHIMMSLPGISRGRAETLLKEFGSVGNFLRADADKILTVHGIGKKTVDKVFDAIWKEVD